MAIRGPMLAGGAIAGGTLAAASLDSLDSLDTGYCPRLLPRRPQPLKKNSPSLTRNT